MHLEDVNVQGFKSFSQKTEMSFQPGISVIIGIRTPMDGSSFMKFYFVQERKKNDRRNSGCDG
jgi:hypothetical protein